MIRSYFCALLSRLFFLHRDVTRISIFRLFAKRKMRLPFFTWASKLWNFEENIVQDPNYWKFLLYILNNRYSIYTNVLSCRFRFLRGFRGWQTLVFFSSKRSICLVGKHIYTQIYFTLILTVYTHAISRYITTIGKTCKCLIMETSNSVERQVLS